MAAMKILDDQFRAGSTAMVHVRLNLMVPAALVLLAAGAWVGMSSVFAWIFSAWWSFAGVGVYSHGYLVLAMSVWMGLVYWRADPPRPLSPTWWALLPLLGLAGMLALMELLYIDSSRALLVPPLMLAAITLVFGSPAGRRLAVPVLFLYAGLLPWWILNPPLQQIATAVVGFLVGLVNVPAYIEGNFIHVPAGVFEIASACSGLSFFITAISLAVFYGAMYLWRWRSRGMLLAAAAGAALVSNWIRIWTLVLIGNYTEMRHWLVGEHYLFGWGVFLIAMAPVLFLARWLEDRDLAAEKNGAHAAADHVEGTEPASSPAVASSVILAAVVGALLLTLPRAFIAAEMPPANTAEPLPLPGRIGVVEQIAAEPDWRPRFINAREGLASYPWREGTVHVYRAVYPEQNSDHHLFLGRNSLVGDNWQPLEQSAGQVELKSGSLTVVEHRGSINGDEHLVWAWYEIAGRPVTGRLGAKLAEIGGITRGRNDGVAMALAMACGLDCDLARRRMQGFIPAAYPVIQWHPGGQ